MPRILVADDNTNIQRMVALALQERGVDVVAVGNGEAAVRKLPDVNPDLVLADVFMPVRNGYEVCEYVKKDTRYSHIPVILLVGAFDPLDEKEARRVGADGVLKKPFIPPDPLIAMVMSALEKNPRIAAELAKAKEVIAAPPPPPEALEIPLHVAPKPLPEYPEPTPEEAAAIYGFGKGVRALGADGDGEEAETSRSNSSKSPKNASTETHEDETFDNASTKSDWRRNAADFEVPENFAYDENLHSDTFPSEKDVPPKHIRVTNEADEQEIVAPENERVMAGVDQKFEAASQEPEETPAGIFGKISAVESAQETPRATWLSDPEPEHAAETFPAVKQETQMEMAREKEPEPKVAPRATEWMDMMAPLSEYPEDGGWMANMSAPHAEAPAPHIEPEAAQPVSVVQPVVSAEQIAEQPAEQIPEQIIEPEMAQVHAHETEPHAASNEHFFADEPYPHPRASSYHFASDSHDANHDIQEAAPEPVTSSASDFGHDLLVAPADSKREQENASGRATPEPLLVDEEHKEPSDYSPHQEDSAPTQHFLPAPADERQVQAEIALAHLEPSVFQPAPVEPALEEFSERIPTLPPPNLEALSQIPFLMPPPIEPAVFASNEAEAEPDTTDVDEVVRKVLEKLQPQLQELFSQGMKPLVENLVHGELTRKR